PAPVGRGAPLIPPPPPRESLGPPRTGLPPPAPPPPPRRRGAPPPPAPPPARFAAVGGEAGALGFPVEAPISLPDGGRASRFQRGRISWSADTGAWELLHEIAPKYEALGAETGSLGYPVAADTEVGDGRGRFARFQGGRISWSPQTGVHVVTGPILERYLELSAEAGTLGYPVSDERYLRDSPFKRFGSPPRREVDFERGTLSYDERTGVVLVAPA
ncbi:MAG: hypothetical protein LH469_00265, partial [Frankiaceae bacterium]|nr:hypothetical protein [Frankiaceae bacterium]